MPIAKKRKSTSKRVVSSKRKDVKRSKVSKVKTGVKINRSDLLYQQIAKKYNKRHLARSRAEEIGLPSPRKIEGNVPSLAQQNLIDAIYLETTKKIKITEFDKTEGVTAENIPEGSRITIKDEKFDDLVTVIDVNPSHIKDVKVESKGSIIAVKSTSLSGEDLVTSVEINPRTREFKEKAKVVEREVFPDKYTELVGNRLLSTLEKPVGGVSGGEGLADQTVGDKKKLLRFYQGKNWYPFYYPKDNFKRLVEQKWFKNIPSIKYLAEKSSLLPKGTKREDYAVQIGQHIQTQSFSIDGEFDFVGLYFQPRSKATNKNPILFVKADQIRADNDDAGHFIAYMNNLYAFNKPFKRNFKVVGEKVKSADEFQAMRFLATSIVNTLGRKRNLAIEDAITKNLGKKALKYRTDTGSNTLTVSEQVVEIVKEAQNKEIIAQVNLPDRKPIDFIMEFDSWTEAKPTLVFKEDKDPETGKIIVHPLDSDSLLKIIVRKYGIDPASGQRLLESLYNQEWITYPRADVQKAEDEPIKIIKEKRAVLESIIAKEKVSKKKAVEPSEQLTLQEYEILKMVYAAQKASDKKENFVKQGKWVLKSGNLILEKPDVILSSEKQSYTDDLFDIEIKKKSVDYDGMLDFLTEHDVGTPATRTAMLERIQNTGILTFRDNNYVIDRRGYYMVAAHNVMDKKVPFVKDLIREIKQVKYDDFKGLNQVVNSFQFIDRNVLAKDTAKEAKRLIGAEHDLTYLDSF